MGVIFESGTQGDLLEKELLKWTYPLELAGLVLTDIQELREKIPEDGSNGPMLAVYLSKSTVPSGHERGIRIFSRKSNKDNIVYNVAYGCMNEGCCKIVIGPPKIESIDSESLLSKKKGLVFYCSECNSLLYEVFG